MRSLLKMAFSIFLIHFTLLGQWVKTSGPDGGTVYSIAFKSSGSTNYVFIGGEGGTIFRSSDDGNYWTEINNSITSKYVTYALTVSGENIFAGFLSGTMGDGVARSTNNGDTWEFVNNGLTNKAIKCLESANNYIFAGTLNGFFRSSDNGASWIAKNSGLTSKSIFDIAVSVIPGGGYNICIATSAGGIFNSTDFGETWIPASTSIVFPYSLSSGGNKILAGTANSGAYLSNDYGVTWQPVNSGFTSGTINDVQIVPNQSGGITFFAGTQFEGMMMSTNEGANWIPSNAGLPIKLPSSALEANNGKIYFGVNWGGLFRSSNYGTSWIQINKGFNKGVIRSLILEGNELFAGTRGGGIFYSADYGETWTPVNSGLPAASIIRSLHSTHNVAGGFALFAGTQYKGVYRSTNKGVSWEEVNNGIPLTTVNALTGKADYLIAGTDTSGIFVSTNNGNSWTGFNSGYPPGTEALCLEISPDTTGGRKLYTGTNGRGVYLSTNGLSWKAMNTGLTDTIIEAISFDQQNVYCGTWGGVFKSSNLGANWNSTSVTSYIPALKTLDGVLFAGGSKVRYSTDQGVTWVIANEGLPLVVYSTKSIVANKDKIFIGQDGDGVWYRPYRQILPVELSSFVISVQNEMVILRWVTSTELNNRGFEVQRTNSEEINWLTVGFVKGGGTITTTTNYAFSDKPGTSGKYLYRLKQIDFDGMESFSQEVSVDFEEDLSFKLLQNYPNPFNPVTTIEYKLNEPGRVEIKLFGVLGNEITLLRNEKMEPGAYKFMLNCDDYKLSSGVLFYQLKHNDKALQRKMIFLR